jgi:hypothetical protein
MYYARCAVTALGSMTKCGPHEEREIEEKNYLRAPGGPTVHFNTQEIVFNQNIFFSI